MHYFDMQIRRVLALALTAALMTLAPSALADPIPDPNQQWPRCGVLPDDDGRYCVESATLDGVEVERPTSGPWYEPFVDLLQPGVVRFGVNDYSTPFTLDSNPDLDPTDRFVLRVNTGDIIPREL